jgi:hypothetical protein
MSIALIDFWLSGSPYQHTTIDDLESFLWLLIWCILCIMEDRLKDGTEVRWLKFLRSPNLEMHAGTRRSILTSLTETRDPRFDARAPHTPLQNLIRPLLRDWDSIRRRGHEEMALLVLASSSSDEDFLTVTRKYVGEFLTTGFHHLATFPDSWDSFIPVRIFSSLSSPVIFDHDPFLLTTEGEDVSEMSPEA